MAQLLMKFTAVSSKTPSKLKSADAEIWAQMSGVFFFSTGNVAFSEEIIFCVLDDFLQIVTFRGNDSEYLDFETELIIQSGEQGPPGPPGPAGPQGVWTFSTDICSVDPCTLTISCGAGQTAVSGGCGLLTGSQNLDMLYSGPNPSDTGQWICRMDKPGGNFTIQLAVYCVGP